MLVLLILFIVTILSIILCYKVAKEHGADPVYWGIIAAILGPLAIPFVFFSKPDDSSNPKS